MLDLIFALSTRSSMCLLSCSHTRFCSLSSIWTPALLLTQSSAVDRGSMGLTCMNTGWMNGWICTYVLFVSGLALGRQRRERLRCFFPLKMNGWSSGGCREEMPDEDWQSCNKSSKTSRFVSVEEFSEKRSVCLCEPSLKTASAAACG